MALPNVFESALALHLLGWADVGAHDTDGYVERLTRLRTGDVGVLLDPLPGAHHAAGPPLASLLERCTRHGVEVAEVALVATQLTGRHPQGGAGNDTEPLARLIAEALARQPDLYGRPLRCHIVLVTEPALGAYASSVSHWLRLRARRRPSRRTRAHIVSLGGGPAEGFLGLIMGCLEAGYVPTVCVTNQDTLGEADMVRLQAEEPPIPWMARAGAFRAAAEIDPDPERAELWRFLDALRRLDWADAQRLRAQLPVDVAEAMDLPPVALGSRPTDAAGWRFYRRLLEGGAFRAVGAGDPVGLAAAREWPVLRIRELTAPGGEQAGRPRPWTGNGDEAVEEYVRAWHLRATAAPAWLESAAPHRSWGPAYEVARRLAHARPVTSSEAQEAARALARAGEEEGDDPLSLALQRLGHAPGPLLPGPGWLVVVCGNRPSLPIEATLQMLSAIEARVVQEGPAVATVSHLRMAVTADGATTARRIVEKIDGRVGSVQVIAPVPVNDFEECRRLVLSSLRAEPWLGAAGRALFVCNPGTKGMNLGAALGVLGWSLEMLRPFSIAPLARVGPGSKLHFEQQPRPVAARLLHDRALATLLPGLLRHVDLDLAHWLSSLGSDRWAPITNRLASLRGRWLRRLPDGARWFPARAELCRAGVAADPWRALHAFCALADQTWSSPRTSGEWTYPWREGPGLEPCRRLWGWRNDGPLGHRFLAGLAAGATAAGISTTMGDAVAALRAAGLVPGDAEPVDRLVSELASVLDLVRSVELVS